MICQERDFRGSGYLLNQMQGVRRCLLRESLFRHVHGERGRQSSSNVPEAFFFRPLLI